MARMPCSNLTRRTRKPGGLTMWEQLARVGTRLVIACCLMAAVGCEAAAKFTMVCGSSASTCTTADNLKIILTLDPPASAEATWADGKTSVSVADRDNPTQVLPDGLLRLQETGTPGERQLSLHSLLDSASRRDESLLSVLYRKPSTAIALQLLISSPDLPHAVLPFTLDLAPAYKEGTLGLMFDQGQPPRCTTRDDKPSGCRIGTVLVLPFENLAQWSAATAHPSNSLVLYLNDIAMTGFAPLPGPVGELTKTPYSVRFVLTRDLATPANASAWKAFLATSDDSSIATTVSVGIDSIRWIYPQAQALEIPLPRHYFVPWIIGAAVLGVIWALAGLTPIVRAYPAVPQSQAAFKASTQQAGLATLGVSEATLQPPHSLSMVFMCLWIMVVSFSFFVFWGLTGGSDLLNTTALALMGIGTTSLVFARAIDTPTTDDKNADQALATAIAAYTVPDAGGVLGRAVTNAMDSARQARLITTGHWMSDLFSEKGSPRLDLHRLQVAAFTAFYFVVFLWSLNPLLALPDFSTNTLALLGISNAGYLGFKFAAQ
jgi:hypothetical protein